MLYLCPQGRPLQMLSEGWPVWPEPCLPRGAWSSISGQLCGSLASTSFLWSWNLPAEPRVPESQGLVAQGRAGQWSLSLARRVGGKGRNNLPSTGGLAVSASQRGRGGEERECVLTPTHCHHHICITKVGPEVPCGFVESPQPSLGDCSLAQVVPSHTATLADKSHIVGRAAAASICSPRHHPGASQLLCGADMARARDTARVRPQAQGQGRG